MRVRKTGLVMLYDNLQTTHRRRCSLCPSSLASTQGRCRVSCVCIVYIVGLALFAVLFSTSFSSQYSETKRRSSSSTLLSSVAFGSTKTCSTISVRLRQDISVKGLFFVTLLYCVIGVVLTERLITFSLVLPGFVTKRHFYGFVFNFKQQL